MQETFKLTRTAALPHKSARAPSLQHAACRTWSGWQRGWKSRPVNHTRGKVLQSASLTFKPLAPTETRLRIPPPPHSPEQGLRELVKPWDSSRHRWPRRDSGHQVPRQDRSPHWKLQQAAPSSAQLLCPVCEVGGGLQRLVLGKQEKQSGVLGGQ